MKGHRGTGSHLQHKPCCHFHACSVWREAVTQVLGCEGINNSFTEYLGQCLCVCDYLFVYQFGIYSAQAKSVCPVFMSTLVKLLFHSTDTGHINSLTTRLAPPTNTLIWEAVWVWVWVWLNRISGVLISCTWLFALVYLWMGTTCTAFQQLCVKLSFNYSPLVLLEFLLLHLLHFLVPLFLWCS